MFGLPQIILTILVGAALISPSFAYPNNGDFLALVLPGKLMEIANQSRANQNLAPLKTNKALEEAAKERARDMAARGYFSHVNPDGENFLESIKDSGYGFSYAGENLAINYADSEEVVDIWLSSGSHRANILNEKFTETGIAVVDGIYQNRPATFVVELFGRPAPTLERALFHHREASARLVWGPTERAPLPPHFHRATSQLSDVSKTLASIKSFLLSVWSRIF